MEANIKIAEQFGNLIAKADYSAAHALLTKEAQKIHSADDIRLAVEQIAPYAPGPIQEVEVMEDFIQYDWPAKQDVDVAWVYVSLTGASYVEAVTVLLAKEGEAIRIRELEWGRP